MVMQQRQHTNMPKRYGKKKDKKNSRITQAFVLIPISFSEEQLDILLQNM